MSNDYLKNEQMNRQFAIKEQKFDVLAVPGRSAFIVSPDKIAEFLSINPNLELRQKNAEMVKKFKINNLNVEDLIIREGLDVSSNDQFVDIYNHNMNNSVLKKVKKPD